MFQSFYVDLGLASLAITAAFAWLKGGPAERAGAVMIAVMWLAVVVIQAVLHQFAPAIGAFSFVLFLSDLLLGAGFLVVAIRYSSVWLGAAMLFEAGSFAAHAFQMADPNGPRWHGLRVYLLITNVMSDLVLLTLFAGTVMAILRRRKLAREKVEASTRTVKRPAWLPADPPPSVGSP
jgi:hypothetical protein